MNPFLSLTLLSAVVALSNAQIDVNADLLVPKQASSRSEYQMHSLIVHLNLIFFLDGIQDQNSAETGFGGGGGGGIENSKYFQ